MANRIRQSRSPEGIRASQNFNPERCRIGQHNTYSLQELNALAEKYLIPIDHDDTQSTLCDKLTVHWTKWMAGRLRDMFRRRPCANIEYDQLVNTATEYGINSPNALSHTQLCQALTRKMIDLILRFRLREFGLQELNSERIIHLILSAQFDIASQELPDRDRLAILSAMAFLNPQLLNYVMVGDLNDAIVTRGLRAEFNLVQQGLSLLDQAHGQLEPAEVEQVAASVANVLQAEEQNSAAAIASGVQQDIAAVRSPSRVASRPSSRVQQVAVAEEVARENFAAIRGALQNLFNTFLNRHPSPFVDLVKLHYESNPNEQKPRTIISPGTQALQAFERAYGTSFQNLPLALRTSILKNHTPTEVHVTGPGRGGRQTRGYVLRPSNMNVAITDNDVAGFPIENRIAEDQYEIITINGIILTPENARELGQLPVAPVEALAEAIAENIDAFNFEQLLNDRIRTKSLRGNVLMFIPDERAIQTFIDRFDSTSLEDLFPGFPDNILFHKLLDTHLCVGRFPARRGNLTMVNRIRFPAGMGELEGESIPHVGFIDILPITEIEGNKYYLDGVLSTVELVSQIQATRPVEEEIEVVGSSIPVLSRQDNIPLVPGFNADFDGDVIIPNMPVESVVAQPTRPVAVDIERPPVFVHLGSRARPSREAVVQTPVAVMVETPSAPGRPSRERPSRQMVNPESRRRLFAEEVVAPPAQTILQGIRNNLNLSKFLSLFTRSAREELLEHSNITVFAFTNEAYDLLSQEVDLDSLPNETLEDVGKIHVHHGVLTSDLLNDNSVIASYYSTDENLLIPVTRRTFGTATIVGDLSSYVNGNLFIIDRVVDVDEVIAARRAQGLPVDEAPAVVDEIPTQEVISLPIQTNVERIRANPELEIFAAILSTQPQFEEVINTPTTLINIPNNDSIRAALRSQNVTMDNLLSNSNASQAILNQAIFAGTRTNDEDQIRIISEGYELPPVVQVEEVVEEFVRPPLILESNSAQEVPVVQQTPVIQEEGRTVGTGRIPADFEYGENLLEQIELARQERDRQQSVPVPAVDMAPRAATPRATDVTKAFDTFGTLTTLTRELLASRRLKVGSFDSIPGENVLEQLQNASQMMAFIPTDKAIYDYFGVDDYDDMEFPVPEDDFNAIFGGSIATDLVYGPDEAQEEYENNGSIVIEYINGNEVDVDDSMGENFTEAMNILQFVTLSPNKYLYLVNRVPHDVRKEEEEEEGQFSDDEDEDGDEDQDEEGQRGNFVVQNPPQQTVKTNSRGLPITNPPVVAATNTRGVVAPRVQTPEPAIVSRAPSRTSVPRVPDQSRARVEMPFATAAIPAPAPAIVSRAPSRTSVPRVPDQSRARVEMPVATAATPAPAPQTRVNRNDAPVRCAVDEEEMEMPSFFTSSAIVDRL